MHSADRSRYQWSYTGTWTRTHGLDRLRHLGRRQPLQPGRQVPRPEAVHAERCRPAGLSRRVLLDARRLHAAGRSTSAATRASAAACRDGDTATHIQAQSSITSVKGQHTLQGGVDVRRAQRDRTGGGNRSGQLTFDRTYTRQFSDESALTPSNLGLSLAAFELGLPTSASINDELPSSFSNYWTAAFAQDTWRLGRSPSMPVCGSSTRPACARRTAT